MRLILAVLLHTTFASVPSADERATYAPGRVVYDLSSPDREVLAHVLDRASVLQNIYGNDPFSASIVIVVHEGAILLFANDSRSAHVDLMHRASGLVMGEVIEFRLCAMSARMQGLHAEDFPKFVTMVPMADAEIVRLQQEGYAYLH